MLGVHSTPDYTLYPTLYHKFMKITILFLKFSKKSLCRLPDKAKYPPANDMRADICLELFILNIDNIFSIGGVSSYLIIRARNKTEKRFFLNTIICKICIKKR